MQSELISDGQDKTYVLVLETGDEAMRCLQDFAQKYEISAAHFTAIGALQNVELGYFDWEKKAYKRLPFNRQMEVLSLIGDIALSESGTPQVHAHAVLGLDDGTVRGGHLLKGEVRPALEIMISESLKSLHRRFDPISTLQLIDTQDDLPLI